MKHLLHIPKVDPEACRRAALYNRMDLALENGDADDSIAALDLLTEELKKQIRQPIPIQFKIIKK